MNHTRTAFAAVLALVAIAAGALLSTSTASAQAPELTYQYPAQGQVLAEPPVFIQMCFSRSVDVRDLDKGGDFSFDLIRPNNLGLGMRIVFQVDGFGVAIYPGEPSDDQINGEWRLEYTVRDRETLETLTGTLNFVVDPAGEPVPQETPPACSPGSTPGGTVPADSGTATATPSTGGEDDDDDGPDVALLVGLTLGIAAIAAIIAVVGYLVRRRGGKSSSGPPPGDPPPAAPQ